MIVEERKNVNSLNNIIQNLVLENRNKLSISGVKDVLSFDDQVVIMETELGLLTIKGENLKINKLIAEKKEIISVDGDMIVPDSKPDILNTICTSGVVSVYKKEIKDEKVRLDGNIDTYIMYMPDGVNDSVRGLNTSLDFSENINVPNCQEGMNATTEIKVKSIDCKVLNGRKININTAM